MNQTHLVLDFVVFQSEKENGKGQVTMSSSCSSFAFKKWRSIFPSETVFHIPVTLETTYDNLLETTRITASLFSSADIQTFSSALCSSSYHTAEECMEGGGGVVYLDAKLIAVVWM